ncbi:MAG TPA: tetratricopeptide repeat protein, partial [Vicinamibacteria bacterium]|nr:tetratricopeptide repeat protein [Vicinamibacteria bacterium]
SFVVPLPFLFGLWILGGIAFTLLAAAALRTVPGLSAVAAVVVAGLGWFAFVLQPCLGFLASPFLLYLAWHYLRGDIGDVLWSFRARQSFRRWLQASTLNPRDADAHYQLGLIHQQRGQREEAGARFRRAVEIDPGELDASYQLGRMAREDGRHADALRHFEAVLSRDDAFAHNEVWREVGSTYLEAGSLAEARWALEKYVGRRTHDPEGLYLLGSAAQQLGAAEAARDAFTRCVEAAETTPGFRRRQVSRWARQARQQLAQIGK